MLRIHTDIVGIFMHNTNLGDDPNPTKPLMKLAGTFLSSEWRAIELLEKQGFQTGSFFSVGYSVENAKGERAFAKILDFSKALQREDTASELKTMLDSYIFERELLKICSLSNFTRIIRGLDYGELPLSDVPLGKIFFIIFEMAEGDVRKYLATNSVGVLSWRLGVLHDVAVGLSQLHKKDIYHQDVKPSNILVFGADKRSKLADLGRAHCSSLAAPHDEAPRPGAFHYAPPEQLYDYQIDDRRAGRQASDLYLLGSMLDFFVTGRPTTVRLMHGLDEPYKPFSHNIKGWRGFYKDVLPHLQDAHARLVEDFSDDIRTMMPCHSEQDVIDELINLYRYSTNPDPLLRGHPSARKMRHSSNYDLQRFIAGFDIQRKKIEMLEKYDSAKSSN